MNLKRALVAHGISPGTVKLLCVHPPYLDSLRFTHGDPRDLSLVRDPDVFFTKLGAFARQAISILAPNAVCALLVGDVRKAGHLIPLGFNSATVFQREGFTLESIIIKAQNQERSIEFYRHNSGGHYLLEHEYLFLFRNPLTPNS